jgi:hypothetical protein
MLVEALKGPDILQLIGKDLNPLIIEYLTVPVNWNVGVDITVRSHYGGLLGRQNSGFQKSAFEKSPCF